MSNSAHPILPFSATQLRDTTIVVKIGGELCTQSKLAPVIGQLGELHNAGVKIALVHGGGPQIDEFLGGLGIPRKRVAGRRITDAETLKAAKMIYNGLISVDIISAFHRHGLSAAGLSGADGGLIGAQKSPIVCVEDESGCASQVDYGFVGDIVSINPAIIEALFAANIIPVICSLGIDSNGQVFNINADTVASKLALGLRADRLVLVTNVPGILLRRSDPSSLVHMATAEQLELFIADGIVEEGMIPKSQACIESIRNGLSSAHIIDGTAAGTPLLDLFSSRPRGTTVVREERLVAEKQSSPAL